MPDITGLATGLANGLNAYLGKKQDLQRQMALKAAPGPNTDMSTDTSDPVLSPEMAEKVLPGFGAQMVTKYNQENPNAPLKLSQGVQYLKTATDALQPPDTSKDDNRQDKLENQYNQKLTSVRGDQSLMRVEKQRDAAGMAYDTIAKAKSENRDLTQLEQSDLIGQLWQARSGKAPTDQDMKQMQDQTAKRGFNHMVTYLTGNPGLVGASTNETLANLQQFVDATGKKADEQWNGYMAPRMVPPTGLDAERASHINSQHRGISYIDQKTTSDKTYVSNQSDSIEAKKAALRAKLGL